MYLKTGDNVTIISGSNKGKTGKVLKTLRAENRVIVEGVNVCKKHIKPNAYNQTGGIIEVERPINASNVMLVDPKTAKPTRIKMVTNKDGKKVRAAVKSNEEIK